MSAAMRFPQFIYSLIPPSIWKSQLQTSVLLFPVLASQALHWNIISANPRGIVHRRRPQTHLHHLHPEEPSGRTGKSAASHPGLRHKRTPHWITDVPQRQHAIGLPGGHRMRAEEDRTARQNAQKRGTDDGHRKLRWKWIHAPHATLCGRQFW